MAIDLRTDDQGDAALLQEVRFGRSKILAFTSALILNAAMQNLGSAPGSPVAMVVGRRAPG